MYGFMQMDQRNHRDVLRVESERAQAADEAREALLASLTVPQLREHLRQSGDPPRGYSRWRRHELLAHFRGQR